MIALKIALEGQKATSKRLNYVAKNMDRNIKRAVSQEAHLLRRIIVMGVRRQAPGGTKFVPLNPKTIARKGSSKALINKGDLIRSINVFPMFGGQVYFVGVHKMSAAKKGIPMANIAEVMEFGTKDGRIPARPYLRPAFAQWKRGVDKRMMTRLVDSLGFGKPFLSAMKMKDKILTGSAGHSKKSAHEISAIYKKGGKLSWKIN